MVIVIVALIVLAVAIGSHHHGRSCQRHRSRGLSVSESVRGPLGTRIRVTKRF